MHSLMLVAIGLVTLAAFFFGAGFLGKSGQGGAAIFLWIWLAISVGNAVFGVTRAGIPLINEIGAFIPIFGIPGALAWYLGYRYGSSG